MAVLCSGLKVAVQAGSNREAGHASDASAKRRRKRSGLSSVMRLHYSAISRTQMLRKLIGADGSPCACNLMAARSYGRYAGFPM